MQRWNLGGAEITRVPDPGFELVLPQDEATTRSLAQSGWLAPNFVTDDLSLRVGSSVLAVSTNDATVLVDPWLAFDDDARFEARLTALTDAGVNPTDVDVVINTHVDGIGANVEPRTGAAAFPNARYLVPEAEIEAIRAGEHENAKALLDLDALEPVVGPTEVTDRVGLIELPGHNSAHVGVEVRGDDGVAVIVGHLFLHPAQIANPDAADLDTDPETIRRTRRSLLERAVTEGLVLVGPLFEHPGGGRVARDGDTYRLELEP